MEKLPSVEDQRKILEQKIRQTKAQAFEYQLNAIMTEAQKAFAVDASERKEIDKLVAENTKHSKQLYAGAAAIEKLLNELPTEAPKTEEKDDAITLADG